FWSAQKSFLSSSLGGAAFWPCTPQAASARPAADRPAILKTSRRVRGWVMPRRRAGGCKGFMTFYLPSITYEYCACQESHTESPRSAVTVASWEFCWNTVISVSSERRTVELFAVPSCRNPETVPD